MNKIIKQIISFCFVALLFAPVIAVHALTPDDLYGGKRAEIQTSIGLDGAKDPRVLAADIIKILLGFLGIIATVIILTAGFQWMTAGGDKGKIDGAKGLMKNGVIGLVIVLSSWALSTFIIDQVIGVTGNGN